MLFNLSLLCCSALNSKFRDTASYNSICARERAYMCWHTLCMHIFYELGSVIIVK